MELEPALLGSKLVAFLTEFCATAPFSLVGHDERLAGRQVDAPVAGLAPRKTVLRDGAYVIF